MACSYNVITMAVETAQEIAPREHLDNRGCIRSQLLRHKHSVLDGRPFPFRDHFFQSMLRHGDGEVQALL